jgi:hypothetical protein
MASLTRANVAALQNELTGKKDDLKGGGGDDNSESQIFDELALTSASIPAKEVQFLVALFVACKGEKWRHKEGWESSQTTE